MKLTGLRLLGGFYTEITHYMFNMLFGVFCNLYGGEFNERENSCSR